MLIKYAPLFLTLIVNLALAEVLESCIRAAKDFLGDVNAGSDESNFDLLVEQMEPDMKIHSVSAC